jgi:hypothetical protein
MRWAHLIVAITFSALVSVTANAQTCAFSAVDAFLKADAEKYKSMNPGETVAEKAGLVPRQSKCPSMQEGGLLEFVDKVQVVSISGDADAALIDTHQCGGGNKHGQYLVISQGKNVILLKTLRSAICVLSQMKFMQQMTVLY